MGNAPLTIKELGRWKLSGNTTTHTVKLVHADGTDVSGGLVTVNMSGGTAGQFNYTALPSPVTLAANTTFYLVSFEVDTWDHFYNWDTSLAASGAVTVNSAAFAYNGTTTYYHVGSTGNSYGPVSFRYDTGAWNLPSETRYLYSGMLLLQERDGANLPKVTYTRGADLSGTLDGAGGIGGLLARSSDYSAGSWATHNYYHADGNGNITYLADSSQNLAASYTYDPFGNTVSLSGPFRFSNTLRFSSKQIHPDSGLYYYGYRFYDPSSQKWLNPDPLSEPGFRALSRRHGRVEGDDANLYRFVRNEPLTKIDPEGLKGKGIIGGVIGILLPGCGKGGKAPQWPQLSKSCADDPDIANSMKKLKEGRSDDGDGNAECTAICDCLAQDQGIVANACWKKCMDTYKRLHP